MSEDSAANEASDGPELLPCPCCAGEPSIIKRGDFHMSFAIYDDSDDTVEHNFLHSIAIICLGCELTMPSLETKLDPEAELAELVASWNTRSPA